MGINEPIAPTPSKARQALAKTASRLGASLRTLSAATKERLGGRSGRGIASSIASAARDEGAGPGAAGAPGPAGLPGSGRAPQDVQGGDDGNPKRADDGSRAPGGSPDKGQATAAVDSAHEPTRKPPGGRRKRRKPEPAAERPAPTFIMVSPGRYLRAEEPMTAPTPATIPDPVPSPPPSPSPDPSGRDESGPVVDEAPDGEAGPSTDPQAVDPTSATEPPG